MKRTILVLSCEHAVNTVHPAYTQLFSGRENVLNSRKAMDLHALNVTQHLSETLACEYTQSMVSRLLVDCNRSLKHNSCFSKYTKNLSKSEKQNLIDSYYLPFREQTQNLIQKHIDQNEQVLHLSIHTFTPILKGLVRNAGIGILYDSRRHAEKEVARMWHALLLQQPKVYRMRKNYPYPGHKFSFPASLRKCYSERDYLAIELEINHVLLQEPESLDETCSLLSSSLKDLLELL